MIEPRPIYQVIGPADEDFPRVVPAHPRNRHLDWREVWDFVQRGTSPTQIAIDIFIKTDRNVDAVWLGGAACFAVSDRARAVLEPMAGGPMQFLGVTVNGLPFWVPHVANLIDALDLERSQLRRAISTGSIAAIEIPVWRADRIVDPSVFRLSTFPSAVWATFSVAEAFRGAGFNGISFWQRGLVG